MSHGGKGSAPRPFSIAHDEWSKRWDAIFGRDLKEDIPVTRCEQCGGPLVEKPHVCKPREPQQ